MKQQNSVFDKFQEFWKGLAYDERKDLWDVMTALRGPDREGMMKIKHVSTCRIRSLFIGTALDAETGTKGWFFTSLRQAIQGTTYRPRENEKIMNEPEQEHFRSHVITALGALKTRYPTKANAIAKSVGIDLDMYS